MDRKRALGLRIRAIREARGMSQERFAELLDRSPDAVSSIERGINLPSIETLLRLSEAVDVPLRDLFDGLEVQDSSDVVRLRLHTELTEIARLLSTRDLEIALKQIKAFPRAR